MKWLREVSVIAEGVGPEGAYIGRDKIVVGEFVDIEGRPEYTELLWSRINEVRRRVERGEVRVAL